MVFQRLCYYIYASAILLSLAFAGTVLSVVTIMKCLDEEDCGEHFPTIER
jgi:hypothetical protein